MAFIPTPKVAKTVLNAVVGTTPIINTLWFLAATDFGVTDLINLADGVATWWQNNIKPLASQDLTLSGIDAYDMSSASGPVESLVYGYTGDITEGWGDAQDVARIKFATANRGRSGRGGNDFSPITDSHLSTQTIDALYRSQLVTAYGQLNFEVQVYKSDAEHCVVSFWNEGVARTEGYPQLVDSYAMVRSNPRTRKTRRSAGS